MAPSGHHRQRFVGLDRQVWRRDTSLQASSTSRPSQDVQITSSSTDVEQPGQFARNAAVVATVVAVICLSFAITTAFCLIRYKRRLRKSMPQTIPVDWSWIDATSPNQVGTLASVRITPAREKAHTFGEWKAEEDTITKPPSIHSASPAPSTPQAPLPDMTDWARVLEALPPPNEGDEMQRPQQSPSEPPFNFHLPSFTFTLPSPMEPAPAGDSRISEIETRSRRDFLDECISSLMAEKSLDEAFPSSDRTGGNRWESETSTAPEVSLDELSWTSDDSRQSFTGPPTPEKILLKDTDSTGHSQSDAGEGDKSGWDLLTKLRKLLPSNTSLKPETSCEAYTSSIAVRRSFTSPAFFTLVSPTNDKPAVCLKPCIPEKLESVASNLIVKFLESDTLELDLMDEALPPPAIIVSPATASTLNLCRQSLSSLERFADATDPWSIAYGASPNTNVASPPAAFDVELSRRRGDPGGARPLRPPKSRRRTYVQKAVEAY